MSGAEKQLYVIACESGPVKIGVSGNPEARRKGLEQQMPHTLRLVHIREVSQPFAVESVAHQILSERRCRGEWFDVTVDEALAAIDRAADLAKLPLINLKADPEVIAYLDAMRRDEEDIPTRSEMVRRVIRRAGEAHAKKRK